jgi:hypothetical protein
MARKRKNSEFLCLDCTVDTCESGEYYIVRDAVWLAVNPNNKGMLCISCLEQRLGRELTSEDFAWVPLNLIQMFQGSDRLKARVDAHGMIVNGLADLSLGDISFAIADAIITEDERIQAMIDKHEGALQ